MEIPANRRGLVVLKLNAEDRRLAAQLSKFKKVFSFSLLFVVMLVPAHGYAQFSCTPSSTTAVWGLGASGDWNVAGNWSSNAVPNSTSVGACILDGKSTVSLTNLSPTVNSLTLNTGNGLNIGSGTSLTLATGNPIQQASIQNAGTITVASGGSLLSQQASTSLSGGGTITMTGGTLGAASSSTLATWNNVDNTIQGYGNIGGAGLDPGGLAFNNEGTILANSSGQTLSFSGGTGVVTLNNTGLAEATGGGTLMFTNLTNEGSGLVLASAGGSVATTVNATIVVGLGSQMIEATSGGMVNLGSTAGNLGASGPINLNANGGTITVGNVTGFADLSITTANAGTITVNGAASWNGLSVAGASTLTVASGVLQIGNLGISNAGTIALNQGELLSGRGTGPQVWTGGGIINMTSGIIKVESTLTNDNNTIQGTGSLEIELGEAFANNGTINANVSGGTISISDLAFNGFSNYGTLEATNGAATLTLNGNLITNSGTVSVGSGSTLTASNFTTYTQSAGTTNIGGTLIAPVVSISGGTLEGSGTIGSTANNAAVTVAGGATIQAGDPPATLSIIGTLDLTNSTDNELIGGSAAGSGYGVLDVSGDLSIAASLLTLEDLNGFNPSNMETFIIANSNGLMGEFTDNTNLAFDGGTFDVSYLTSGCAAGYLNCIELTFHGSTTAAEPGTVLLLAIMLAAFVLAGPAARVMKSRA